MSEHHMIYVGPAPLGPYLRIEYSPDTGEVGYYLNDELVTREEAQAVLDGNRQAA